MGGRGHNPILLVIAGICASSCAPRAPNPPPSAAPLLPIAARESLYALDLRRGEVPYPQDGFYAAEGEGNRLVAWTRDVLRIRVDVPCRGAVRAAGRVAFPFGRPARLQVVWNDVPVAVLGPSDAVVEIDVAIPAERVVQGPSVLELRFPDALVPAEVDPSSPDTRRLGGRVSRLRLHLERLPPAAPMTVTPSSPVEMMALVPEGAELWIVPERGSALEAPLELCVRDEATGAIHRAPLHGAPPWWERLDGMAGASARITIAFPDAPCGATPAVPLREVAMASAVPPAPAPEALKGPIRTLLVGIDGATFDVIDPAMRAGRLPVLESIVRRGVRATLCSLPVDHSPVVWATISTGREPEAHGILDFLYRDTSTGDDHLYTARHRRCPTVWEILGKHGLGTGAIGWWNTWPAARVEGYLLSDLLWPLPMGRAPSHRREAARHTVFPDSLAPELLGMVVDRAACAEAVSRLGCRPEDWFYLAEDLTTLAWAEHMLGKSRPAFMTVYLKNLDAFQHRYWRFHDPGTAFPRFRPTEDEVWLHGEVIGRYHELLDRSLGKLLELVGDQANVVIVSDHGFGPAGGIHNGEVLSGGHRPEGILIAAGPDFLGGLDLGNASVYDVTPTLLALHGLPAARDMPGRVLSEALRDHRELPRPPSYQYLRPEMPRPDSAESAESGGVPREDDLLDRLEALGYIDR